MTRRISPELQDDFSQILDQLRQSFGEDLVGAYALVQDEPHIIAVIEDPMTQEQRASLDAAYREALNSDIGLTVFTTTQLQQGYPYDCDYSYQPDLSDKLTPAPEEQALINTALLRVMRQRGYALAGLPASQRLPAISNDEYRVVLQHEAEQRLTQLARHPGPTILHLCRILAFCRIGLVLPTVDAGAWSLKNLDPRFQAMIERAATEYQSGTEPGGYNTYQLDQFAEYVRDMLRRSR